MVTVLSQYKLFCPAAECNESVPYANFAKHKESCPALNKKPCPHCKKLYWKNDFEDHFICFDELNKTAQISEKKIVELELKITELELKIKPITQSRDAHAQNNNNLKVTNQNYSNRIRQLQADLASERQTARQLHDELSSQREETHYNVGQLEEFGRKTQNLEHDLEMHKTKIENQKNALAGLHRKINEQKTAEQQLEQELELEIRHNKVLVANMKESNANLKKLADLESRYVSLSQRKESLEHQVQKEFQQRADLTKKLHEAKQQSQMNLGKAEMSAMTISRLRSKIDKMNTEAKPLRDLEEELKSAYQQISYLNNMIHPKSNKNVKSQKKSSGFLGLFK